MLKELGFYKGVNLGGWMSQCDYSEDRLDHFITEPDFRQIADWGFDHVRIPIDYNVVQNADGSMKTEGLERIDAALALCRKYRLNAVLDLHKTQGFSFDKDEGEAGFLKARSTRSCSIGSGRLSPGAMAHTRTASCLSCSTRSRNRSI